MRMHEQPAATFLRLGSDLHSTFHSIAGFSGQRSVFHFFTWIFHFLIPSLSFKRDHIHLGVLIYHMWHLSVYICMHASIYIYMKYIHMHLT